VFDTLLIANRGEIACRVIQALHERGIEAAVGYSDADAGAVFVDRADVAVHLGPASATESYLVIEKVVAAALESGCQAVHPGYGFLSENPKFAKALEKEDVAFIGPPVKAIEAMGDKITSKKLASQAGVTTVPGYMGLIGDADEAVKIANQVGYPVMIKASAGGGGKGMRIAWSDDQTREGYDRSKSEAASAFGDDRIFIDLNLDGDETSALREESLAALAAAGHPVIRIRLASALDLVQEVFRWQIATAVAGSVLGVHPFDQPDVDAAKVKSLEFLASNTDADAKRISADLEAEGLSLFASSALKNAIPASADPVAWMRALLASLGEHDVFAMNVFLEDSEDIRQPLESLRRSVGADHKIATTLAFGPRYLHSSGQLQKGGPNTFVGLQIWQGASRRAGQALEIPRLGGNFGRLAEAQAIGDFSVLGERNRRVIGVDVGSEPEAAIASLVQWIEEAIA